jgi:hypothetical protein
MMEVVTMPKKGPGRNGSSAKQGNNNRQKCRRLNLSQAGK